MPKYVAAKDLKSSQESLFNSSESGYMNKKSVVKKVIKKLNAEHRRHKLEKALNKMNVEDVVMLGMAIENAIKKEIKAGKQTDE
jgi:Ribonuclease G/E